MRHAKRIRPTSAMTQRVRSWQARVGENGAVNPACSQRSNAASDFRRRWRMSLHRLDAAARKHTHARTRVRERTHTHTHTHRHRDTDTHRRAFANTYACTHAHAHAHTCTRTYMRTHARRHTQTHALPLLLRSAFVCEPFGRATHSARDRPQRRTARGAPVAAVSGHRCVVARRPMAHPTSAPGLVMLSGATVVQTPREALRRTELREREGRCGAERDTPYRWFGCATITHAPMHTSRLRPLSVEMAEALIAHLGALSKLSECCLAFSPFPVYSPTRPPARTARRRKCARARPSPFVRASHSRNACARVHDCACL
jgi:hypothetical protein